MSLPLLSVSPGSQSHHISSVVVRQVCDSRIEQNLNNNVNNLQG